MKQIRTRSAMILLMTLAFLFGLAYHTANLVIHAQEWALSPYNEHLTAVGDLAYGGTIYDRNGIELAYSSDGVRYYSNDEQIRRSCLHIVGDDSTNIANSIQNIYRSELMGYDFVFAFGMPKNFRKGKDITLTIDTDLQKAALNALGEYKGAVVFYNYQTGEIVCMVSTPAYDPQNVPEDIETNDLYEGAYLNRVLSGVYPPGSTFKLVTGAAGLENIDDIEDKIYLCTGSDKIGGKDIVCESAIGNVNLKDALAFSCNAYFGHLAYDLGKEKMTQQAQKMGFNQRISFDGLETAKSIYDVSEATDNDLAWSGVGQYTVLETPMNMAMISAAIANDGVPVMPYVVQNITDSNFHHQRTMGNRMMSSETAQKLYDMMDYTVDINYGKYRFSDTLDVCAKTGTAEAGDYGEAHAWITGFCKDEDCPLAFSVIVEDGGSGYQTAIPVAAAVLEVAAQKLDE